MKIALVYDRVNKFGGAERLLLSIHRLFPKAPIFTLVFNSGTATWAKGIKVYPTFLNLLPFLRSNHEWLSPIAPLAFEALNLSAYDLIISITSSDAKSILTKPGQLHVCYCLTPTRYFWSGVHEYLKDIKYKIIPHFLMEYFKYVDIVTSSRPDHYISISNEVNKRVKKYYNRESLVVYPPIEDKFYSKKLISMDKRDYFLIVSRLVPYKKVDLAILAFNKLGLPLVVVGIGSETEKLKKLAKENITFAGAVDDLKLIEYYRHAKAVVFPQDEDFGLVPLEAQACGTPVIAYAKGGALETIIDKKTGCFFEKQTVESLVSAINLCSEYKIKAVDCQKNALRFNFSTFSRQFLLEIKRLQS